MKSVYWWFSKVVLTPCSSIITRIMPVFNAVQPDGSPIQFFQCWTSPHPWLWRTEPFEDSPFKLKHNTITSLPVENSSQVFLSTNFNSFPDFLLLLSHIVLNVLLAKIMNRIHVELDEIQYYIYFFVLFSIELNISKDREIITFNNV